VSIHSIRLKLAGIGVMLLAGSLAFAQNGTLKVKTNCGRAGVFVDDQYVGPAANFGMTRGYSVAAGEHNITLREPRYESATTRVTVAAGKTVTVKQDLKALPTPKGPFGRLRTPGHDKYTAVYVNGQYMGHADEFDNFAQGLLLPPGEYTVKLGTGAEQKVTLKANETTIVK